MWQCQARSYHHHAHVHVYMVCARGQWTVDGTTAYVHPSIRFPGDVEGVWFELWELCQEANHGIVIVRGLLVAVGDLKDNTVRSFLSDIGCGDYGVVVVVVAYVCQCV